MPKILPIRDLRNTSEISEMAHKMQEPIFITKNGYSDLVVMSSELYERFAQIKENEQRAEEFMCDDAEIFVVAFGASSRVSRSAVMQARAEGIKAGLIRPITLWPFPDKTIEKNVDKAKKFLCVEMNMGQMVDDVKLVVNGRKDVEFFGRTGGIIPTPAEVLGEIRKLAGKEN